MLVTLPFVLLLLDYWPMRRLQPENPVFKTSSLKKLIIEKLPLFVLVVVSCVITYIVQQKGGAMVHIHNLPLSFRISNAMLAYIKYMAKMIYPVRLTVLYPLPTKHFPLWQPILSFVILTAISAAVIYTARRRKYLPVGWLWFVGTLIPVIGLVQVGAQTMADRYTYLPLIGLFIMIAWGIADLTSKWRYQKVTLGITSAIVIIAMLICTRLQLRYWKDGFTLYEHTLAVTKNNYVMHNNFGDVLYNKGQTEQALDHFNQALQIKPEYADALNNKGRAFIKLGKIEEAVEILNKALRLNPNSTQALTNLGTALKKHGNLDQAIQQWQNVLNIDPENLNIRYSIALALAQQQKYDDAIDHFNEALRIKPNWPEVHYNLASVYSILGRKNLAVNHYSEALRLKPDYLKASVSLAHTLYELGQIQSALAQYYEALQYEPDLIEALNGLAWILSTTDNAEIRNPQSAIDFAHKACQLTNYQNPGLLDTLAAAYAADGKFPIAIQTAQKAIKLAQTSEQKNLENEIQKHLLQYKASKPYLEPLPKTLSD